MLLASLILAVYTVDCPTQIHCRFMTCLMTLSNSGANKKFELFTYSLDETEIRQLYEYSHKIVKISFTADGIGYECLSPFRDIIVLERLYASKYTSQGLDEILSNLSPSRIQLIEL
jgi:hypothetical protein